VTAPLPPGRYSRNAGREAAPATGQSTRRRTVAISVAGGLFGLGVAWVGYQNLSAAPVSGDQLAFTLVDDSTVSIRFDVTRDDPSQPAVCILRARSLDGSETGRREVYIPPSTEGVMTVTSTVRTSKPPVASDVYGCGLTVPAYLVP
jgi:hypothetical protein